MKYSKQIILSLIVICLTFIFPSKAHADQWNLTDSLNVNHGNTPFTLLQNGGAMVAGGGTNSPTNVTEIFNPSTASWTESGNLNTAREDTTPILLNNGDILMAGGYAGDGSNAFNSTELWDPSTGQWTYTGNLNIGRINANYVKLQDGRILAFGGILYLLPTEAGTTTSEIYDPSTGEWTDTGNTINGIQSTSQDAVTSAVLLNNGQVLALDESGDSELYNPSSGTWSLTGNLFTPRGSGQLILLKMTLVSVNSNWGATGRQIDVDKLNHSWVEGNGTWFQNGYRGIGSGVTWNCSVDSDIPNDSADCSGSTAWDMLDESSWPFDDTPTATATITNNETGTVTFNVSSDVQAFLNGTANNGWLIRKDDESQEGDLQFGSRESAYVPQLVITDH